MQNPELRPLIDRFYRGSSGSAEERVKLFKLIWDAMGSEFGARHEWYELNYGGNAEHIRLDTLRFAGSRGSAGRRRGSSTSACPTTTSTGGRGAGSWVWDGGRAAPAVRARAAEGACG